MYIVFVLSNHISTQVWPICSTKLNWPIVFQKLRWVWLVRV